jgi:hypothetical protein
VRSQGSNNRLTGARVSGGSGGTVAVLGDDAELRVRATAPPFGGVVGCSYGAARFGIRVC